MFSWGFGGYGRLGHSEQKDEHTPRMIQLFERQGRGALQVFAGTSCSIAVNEMGKVMCYNCHVVVVATRPLPRDGGAWRKTMEHQKQGSLLGPGPQTS